MANNIINPMWKSAEPYVMAPYKDNWEFYKEQKLNYGFEGLEKRDVFIHDFSYSVTSPHALDFIKQHAGDGIVEIGAGKGYWGYCLSQMGIDIHCWDSFQWDYASSAGWFPVWRGGTGVAKHYSKRTLMLCWPPYGSRMAAKALHNYKGDKVIYIGEWNGCTAEESFHEMLQTEWELIDHTPNYNFFGFHDEIFIFRRL